MRKIISNVKVYVLAAAISFTCLTGCGSDTVEGMIDEQKTDTEVTTEATTAATTEEVTEATTEKATEEKTTEADTEDKTEDSSEDKTEASKDGSDSGDDTAKDDETIDLDLTNMSSTMVYSEVLNMMSYPDDYKGKRIKITGTYYSVVDSNNGNTYYYCLIQDATACCANGLEFVLNDGNYPDENTEITIDGVFTTYFEGDFEYVTLLDAKRDDI
jgi:uncharacterized membrane protein YcgQ (UPF0703/DUF1980 family)